MHSVLAILSPSSPVTRPVAGSVTASEADPGDGFGRLLAADGAAEGDDKAEDSPSGAEALGAMANPVLVWAGPVAADGGIEAEALTEAVGRSGMGEAKLAPAMTPDAALASGIPLIAEPVPGWRGAGGVSGAMPNDIRGGGPVGAGAVEAVRAEMDPTAGPPGHPEAAAGDLGIRQARGRAGPVLQAETPVAMAGTPSPGSGHDPVDGPGRVGAGSFSPDARLSRFFVEASGQEGAGRADADPADIVTGGAIGTDEGSPALPIKVDPGLAPSARTTPIGLPAPTDPKAAPREAVLATQPEGMTAGQAMPVPEGAPVGAAMPGEQAPASGDAVQGAAQGGTGGRPQGSFWERLLSGMIDARPAATAADDAAGQFIAARPADRSGPSQVAPAGDRLPVLPVEPPVGPKPGVVEAGTPIPTGWADAPPSPDADPSPLGTDHAPSADSPRIAAVKNGLQAIMEPGPMPVPDPRIATSGPDAVPEVFDDPVLFALPGIPAFAPLAGPGPAAIPVPVPQLAAQLTAELKGGTEGETELALSPEELGHVRVKLKPDAANPDRMVVMITFERPETLDLFRRHAGELTDALRAAGYSGADLGFGQQGSGQTGADPGGRAAARSFDDISRTEAVGPPQPSPRHSGAASLDLRL